jgi:hypothetical protein
VSFHGQSERELDTSTSPPSRPQLAARAAVVRDAIDMMVTQAKLDGGPVPECVGSCKMTLYHLERQLRERAKRETQLLTTEFPIQTRALPSLPRTGSYSPTARQVAYFRRLVESPVFTQEERARALEWLRKCATKQLIKDQLTWLARQVETRSRPS